MSFKVVFRQHCFSVVSIQYVARWLRGCNIIPGSFLYKCRPSSRNRAHFKLWIEHGCMGVTKR